MSERRKRLVGMAFSVLDKDGSGVIDPEDIVDTYDASKHPDVLAGKKSAEEVFREFLDTFDVGGEKDGKVTRNEFANYYSNVSSSIDDDDYFGVNETVTIFVHFGKCHANKTLPSVIQRTLQQICKHLVCVTLTKLQTQMLYQIIHTLRPAKNSSKFIDPLLSLSK